MQNIDSRMSERNLLFAGIGLTLGILTRDKVIRAFTEWLLDKKLSLGEILESQKAISAEQRVVIDGAVNAHIQQEGGEEKALATLNNVKDLESDLEHLADSDIAKSLVELHSLKNKIQSARTGKGSGMGYPETKHSGPFKEDSDNQAGDPYQTIAADKISHIAEGGRYCRKSFLDSGALGEVWIANDTEINRLVVVKYIKPDQAQNSLQKALFHLEGEVTGYLEHPNIAPVYGLGEDSRNRSFYAMRYIRGRKLTRAIADFHSIPKGETGRKKEALVSLLQSFQSACMAVEYAHSRGVIHCDLKPDNIMVGQFGETMVVDWGLVLIKGIQNSDAEVTKGPGGQMVLENSEIYKPSPSASGGLHLNQGGQRNYVGGTPAYMAPEQMRATMGGSVQEVNATSDIFALGATLYHILTNRAPLLPDKINKEKPKEYYDRVEKAVFPTPRSVDGKIPKPLEAIILKSMAVDPDKRYSTARDIADNIKKWISDEPVEGYQESFLEKSSRWMRKNRTIVAVLTMLLACTTFGSVGYGLIVKGHNYQLKISEEKALQNARIAIQERDKAEKSEKSSKENEKFAIEAVRRYANIVAENPELKNRLELEVLRKDLLTEPMKFFQNLIAQLNKDENLTDASKHSLGLGLYDLASIKNEIGNKVEAVLSYERAISIFDELANKDKSLTTYKIDLANAQNDLGYLLGTIGKYNDSVSIIKKSIANMEDVIKIENNHNYIYGQIGSYENLMAIHGNNGHLTEALACLEKALSLAEQLVKAAPSNADYLGIKAHLLHNLGIYYLKTGNPINCLENLQKARIIQESLVKSLKDNPDLQEQLAQTYDQLGVIERYRGKMDVSLAHFKKSMTILSELCTNHPTIIKYSHQLSVCYNNIGSYYFVNANRIETLKFYLKSLEIHQRLSKLNPDVGDLKKSLALTYFNLTIYYLATAQFTKSYLYFNRYAKIRIS